MKFIYLKYEKQKEQKALQGLRAFVKDNKD